MVAEALADLMDLARRTTTRSSPSRSRSSARRSAWRNGTERHRAQRPPAVPGVRRDHDRRLRPDRLQRLRGDGRDHGDADDQPGAGRAGVVRARLRGSARQRCGRHGHGRDVERPPRSRRIAGRVAGAVQRGRTGLRRRSVDGGADGGPRGPGSRHRCPDRQPVRRGRVGLPVGAAAGGVRQLRGGLGAAVALRARDRGVRRGHGGVALGVPRDRRPRRRRGGPDRAGRPVPARNRGRPRPDAPVTTGLGRCRRRRRAGRRAARFEQHPGAGGRRGGRGGGHVAAAAAPADTPRRARTARGDRDPGSDERERSSAGRSTSSWCSRSVGATAPAWRGSHSRSWASSGRWPARARRDSVSGRPASRRCSPARSRCSAPR